MNPFYVEAIALINTFQRHQQGQREPDKKKNPSTFAEILEKKRRNQAMEKTQGRSGAEVVGYLIGVTAVTIFLPAFVVLMALNVLRAVFFSEIPVLTY